jgi:putative peptide zinc metalloprotease protein
VKSNSLKIFETDFEGKFLVIYNENNVFYSNSVVNYVLTLYNQQIELVKICELTNVKFATEYEVSQISDFISGLNLDRPQKSIYKKIANLFDSGKIPQINSKLLSNQYFFFLSIFSFFCFNLYFAIKIWGQNITFKDSLIVFCIMLLVSVLHEIGHAVIAKINKINSGKVGIGWYFLFPVFYINLNEIWRLKRLKRIMVNLGGIYFQLLIGLFFIFCSFNVNSVIFSGLIKLNFLLVAINLNPFIKFDGYWVLSDYLNDKNLHSKSSKIIKDIIHFKRPKDCSISLILYSFGRLLFLVFIYYILLKLIFQIVYTLWIWIH